MTDIFSLQANFKMFLFLSSRNFLSYFSTLCNFKCLLILNYNYFYINPYVIWVFTNDKKLEGLTLSTPDHFIIVTEASFDILKSQAI